MGADDDSKVLHVNMLDAEEVTRHLQNALDGSSSREARIQATRVLQLLADEVDPLLSSATLAVGPYLAAYLSYRPNAEEIISFAFNLAPAGGTSLTRTHAALRVLRRIVRHSPRVARDLIRRHSGAVWTTILDGVTAPPGRRASIAMLAVLSEAITRQGAAVAREVLGRFDWGAPKTARGMAVAGTGMPTAVAALLAAALRCTDRDATTLVLGVRCRGLMRELLQTAASGAYRAVEDIGCVLFALEEAVEADEKRVIRLIVAAPKSLDSIAILAAAGQDVTSSTCLEGLVRSVACDATITSPEIVSRLIYAAMSGSRNSFARPLKLVNSLLRSRPDAASVFLAAEVGKNEPALSTQWLCWAAVVAQALTCRVSITNGEPRSDISEAGALASLTFPEQLASHGFLDRCLSHPKRLIRFTGLLLLFGAIKRVEKTLALLPSSHVRAEVLSIMATRLPSLQLLLQCLRSDGPQHALSMATAMSCIDFYHRSLPRVIAQGSIDVPKVVFSQDLFGASLFATTKCMDLCRHIAHVAPGSFFVGVNGRRGSRCGMLLERVARGSEEEQVFVVPVVRAVLHASGLFPCETEWEVDMWILALAEARAPFSQDQVDGALKQVETVLSDGYEKPFALLDLASRLGIDMTTVSAPSLLLLGFIHRMVRLEKFDKSWPVIEDIIVRIIRHQPQPKELVSVFGKFLSPLKSEHFPVLSAIVSRLADENGGESGNHATEDTSSNSSTGMRRPFTSVVPSLNSRKCLFALSQIDTQREPQRAQEILAQLATFSSTGAVNKQTFVHVLRNESVVGSLFSDGARLSYLCLVVQYWDQFPGESCVGVDKHLQFIFEETLEGGGDRTVFLKFVAGTNLPSSTEKTILRVCCSYLRRSREGHPAAEIAQGLCAVLENLNSLRELSSEIEELIRIACIQPEKEFTEVLGVLLPKSIRAGIGVTTVQGALASLIQRACQNADPEAVARTAIVLRFVGFAAESVYSLLDPVGDDITEEITVSRKDEDITKEQYSSSLTDRDAKLLFWLPVLDSLCTVSARCSTVREQSLLRRICSAYLPALVKLDLKRSLTPEGRRVLAKISQVYFDGKSLSTVLLASRRKSSAKKTLFCRAARLINSTVDVAKERSRLFGTETLSLDELADMALPLGKEIYRLTRKCIEERAWTASRKLLERLLAFVQESPEIGNNVKKAVGKHRKHCRRFLEEAVGCVADTATSDPIVSVRLLLKLTFKSLLPTDEVLSALSSSEHLQADADDTVLEEIANLIQATVRRIPKEECESASSLGSLYRFVCKHYSGQQTSKDRAFKRACDTFNNLGHFVDKFDGEKWVGLLDQDPRDALDRLYSRLVKETLWNKGPKSPSYEGVDPFDVVNISLRAILLAIREPDVQFDIRRFILSGTLGVCITSLSSGDDGLRTSAYGAIAGLTQLLADREDNDNAIGASVSASLFKDRKQVLFVLRALRDTISTPLEILSPTSTTFLRMAIPVLIQPTHDLYRPLYSAMVEKSFDTCLNGAVLASLLRIEGQHARSACIFALAVAANGCTTKNDVLLFRRHDLFSIILTTADPADQKDPLLRRKAWETLARMSLVSHASRELYKRHDVLKWLSTRQAPSVAKYRFELISNVFRQISRDGEGHIHSDLAREVFSSSVTHYVREEQLCEETVDVLVNAAESTASFSPKRRPQFAVETDLLLKIVGFADGRLRPRCFRLVAYGVLTKPLPEKIVTECISGACGPAGDYPQTGVDRNLLLATAVDSIMSDSRYNYSVLGRTICAANASTWRKSFSTELLNYCGLAVVLKSHCRPLLVSISETLALYPAPDPVLRNVGLLETLNIDRRAQEAVTHFLLTVLTDGTERALSLKRPAEPPGDTGPSEKRVKTGP